MDIRKWIASLAGTAVLLVLAWNGWQHYLDGLQPTLVASGNGRIDATEVDVATRLPGSVYQRSLVNEGAMVTAGQRSLHAWIPTSCMLSCAKQTRDSCRRSKGNATQRRSQTTPERADLCAQRVRSLQPTEQRRSRLR